MIEIYLKDVKEQDKFEKFGEEFTKIFGNDEKHIYVFKRVKETELGNKTNYEVIKGVKFKNPDGSIVYIYPKSQQFGVYGYYILGYNPQYAYDRIVYRLRKFDTDVEQEFLNTRIQLC